VADKNEAPKLPPLGEPKYYWHEADDPDECELYDGSAITGDCPQCTALYTAAQMTAYAAQAVREERERCAQAVESLRDKWVDGSDQWGRPCLARVLVRPRDCAAAIRSQPMPGAALSADDAGGGR
jgi:hypothetical protein